jgi:HSP20 family protein
MKVEDIRQGFGAIRETVADAWDRLRRSAAGALTRFRPGAPTALPPAAEVDTDLASRADLWAVLGGDIFEDEKRVVVRLEAPGLEKEDFQLEVAGDTLWVRGDKRFEREATEGRWRVVECAYGSFERAVPLPAAVQPSKAQARYRNGVLRVELPKLKPGRPSSRTIPVG